MITTVNEGLTLIRKHKIMTLALTEGFPSLIVEIVGEPIKGSWWGHEKANLIYMISNGISTSNEVLTVKLVNGKISYVHRDLWSALYRIVTDNQWRKSKLISLKPISQEILKELEKRGKFRIDEFAKDWGLKTKSEKRDITKAKMELETNLLVFSHQFHTEKGYHTTEIMLWELWASDKVKRNAEKIKLKEAMDKIAEYCNDIKLSIF